MGGETHIMYMEYYQDRANTVTLELEPDDSFVFTWGQWAEAIGILGDFYRIWESVECDFLVG